MERRYVWLNFPLDGHLTFFRNYSETWKGVVEVQPFTPPYINTGVIWENLELHILLFFFSDTEL